MKLIFFETTDSTNTYAKLNIENLEDKTVIYTNFQTKGRGRFDRTWVNLGPDNIYMSIVLKPSEKFEQTYSNLTQYLSVCLCRLLEDFGLKPEIKWPNDVLIKNKKVSGILAEAVFKGQSFKGIVLGIGVNLNANSSEISNIDRPATSINLILGKSVNKTEFMKKLLEEFFTGYDEFLEHGFKSIKKEYEKKASFLNKNLKIAVFEDIKEGYCKSIDDFGNLILVDKNGHEQQINMGEIIAEG